MDGWMGGSCQISKNRIDLDLIEVIQFCLKIYDLWRHPYLWVGEWVVGWLGGLIAELMGRSCEITKNLINFDFIKILQLCLKIYD